MKTTMRRTELIDRLKTLLGPEWFIKPSEFFDPSMTNAIWTTNEQPAPNGLMLYDTDRMETNPLIAPLLEAARWYIEPYDPGTLMLYPC